MAFKVHPHNLKRAVEFWHIRRHLCTFSKAGIHYLHDRRDLYKVHKKSRTTHPINEKLGRTKLKLPGVKIKSTFKQINIIVT